MGELLRPNIDPILNLDNKQFGTAVQWMWIKKYGKMAGKLSPGWQAPGNISNDNANSTQI